MKDQNQLEIEGVEALKRLLPIAQGFSGQCRIVAAFLLGLYDGNRFPFNMNDFRVLDHAVFTDCLAVLRMDANPKKEVHTYFDNGNAIWEELAVAWSIKDHINKNLGATK